MSEFEDLEEINLSSPIPRKPHLAKTVITLKKRGAPITRFPKWKQELYASRASSPKRPISLKTKEG